MSPASGSHGWRWEFEKYIDGLTTLVRWHNGRCVAYGEGLAFLALADAVRARLRTVAAAPDDDAGPDPAELLEAGLARYVDDDAESSWLRPRLGALLGVGSAGSFPREDLFAAWTTFFERVGEGENPIVLVIDDAHHADAGLLAFVDHLIGVARFPCFVVLLSRPGLLDQHPGLAANRRATVRHLTALGESDMASLVDGLVVGLPERCAGRTRVALGGACRSSPSRRCGR